MINLNNKKEKLEFLIDLAWEIYLERLCKRKIKLNLEASMQLHFSSIINSLGEILTVTPREKFSIDLEHKVNDKYLDIQTSFNHVKAAIELKCFRKQSNRAKDIDMYDALNDIARLDSMSGFSVRRFICLTDDVAYLRDKKRGHAKVVSLHDGRKIHKNDKIVPTWTDWKNKSRNKELQFSQDIELKWSQKDIWHFLIVNL